MKIRTLSVVAASLLALSACKEDQAAAPANAADAKPPAAAPAAAGALGTQEQKVSYILGMNIGRQFKSNEVPLDIESFVDGIKSASTDAEPKLSPEEVQKTMAAFQEQMEKKRAEVEQKRETEMAAKATLNKEEGAKFLETNKAKQGVTTTASGLQYEVIKEGTGPKPKPTDTVTVHYVGTLIDGVEFDSSIKRNEPAVFPINAVIPGWQEALQLMSEGSKYKVVIPSELAYGPGGTGGEIGPNAVLTFEVELLKVGPTEPPAEVQPIDGAAHQPIETNPPAEAKPAEAGAKK
jgi:FKBP-type peptidyl-prolyl cis-trans isomerase